LDVERWTFSALCLRFAVLPQQANKALPCKISAAEGFSRAKFRFAHQDAMSDALNKEEDRL
jgi:hypothetical protein